MNNANKQFRDAIKEQYPSVSPTLQSYKLKTKQSTSKDIRNYMWKIMGLIGLEIETRFSDFAKFETDKGDKHSFRLFGRQKSKKSIKDKRKENTNSYWNTITSAIKGNDLFPSTIRPIFDFYAFKFIAPHIQDTTGVLKKVILDIMNDIVENETDTQSITECTMHIESLNMPELTDEQINKRLDVALDFIERISPEKYSDLREQVLMIRQEKVSSDEIKEILNTDFTDFDVSSLTYEKYYEKLLLYYTILKELEYEESFIVRDNIDSKIKEIENELNKKKENGEEQLQISDTDCEDYTSTAEKLLEKIKQKRTSKLDLAVGSLILYDVFNTSISLQKSKINLSKDSSRIKGKRTPTGYAANFTGINAPYYVNSNGIFDISELNIGLVANQTDIPHILTAEMQVQSQEGYENGQIGTAAHKNMVAKKRPSLESPEETKKVLKRVPRGAEYIKNGIIETDNRLRDFRKYYPCQSKEESVAFATFVAKNNINDLDVSFIHVSYDDVPLKLTCVTKRQNEQR